MWELSRELPVEYPEKLSVIFSENCVGYIQRSVGVLSRDLSMIDFENCLGLIQGMVCYVSRELCVISQRFACNGLSCTQILHGIYPENCVDLSR